MHRRLSLAALLVAMATAVTADETLLAPRAGERLDGGRDATLWWTADSLPAHVKEWEAFLSIDGGAYYGFRITPHLDVHTRTFRWRVPNIEASDARLLLRVGDEVTERVIEFPQSFAIVPRYGAPDLTATLSNDAGEPAIEGGAPTIEWVSADLVRHRRRDSTATSVPTVDAWRAFETVGIANGSKALRVPLASQRLFVSRALRLRDDTRSAIRPVLLLTTRLNV